VKKLVIVGLLTLLVSFFVGCAGAGSKGLSGPTRWDGHKFGTLVCRTHDSALKHSWDIEFDLVHGNFTNIKITHPETGEIEIDAGSGLIGFDGTGSVFIKFTKIPGTGLHDIKRIVGNTQAGESLIEEDGIPQGRIYADLNIGEIHTNNSETGADYDLRWHN